MDRISDDLYVYVRDMYGIVEIKYMQNRNSECPIKVLSGNRYLVKSTGEIFDFDKTGTDRTYSYKSLKRTFRNLRYLINNNFFGHRNELFVTLTYGGKDRPLISLEGAKRFYMDFKVYIKGLRRAFGKIEFISVVEPHADGHLHAHVLLKFVDYSDIFIKNDDMQNVYWKHGFTKTSNLVGVTNIGAYLSAYLSDVEVSDSVVNDCIKNGEKIVVKELNGKRYIKGARLKYYPKKFNIYRRSRGIREPDIIKGFSGKIKKEIGVFGMEPDFSCRFDFCSNDFTNTIIYEHFNLR